MLNDFLILMQQELVVTSLLFLLLILKLSRVGSNRTYLALALLMVPVAALLMIWSRHQGVLFAGMFVSNPLAAAEKTILLIAVFVLLLVNYDWLEKQEHLPELLMLLCSSLLGMMLMVSSGNLLMFYLSLELSTIPVAAMANFDLHKKASGEAAMKMILSSALASGILLFGISLLYGATGTINFQELPAQIVSGPLVITGFLLFFSGFAFKLSVVPFHFWTADVYEGAPVAVTSFLSVVSKGAVAFIFITVLYHAFQPMGSMTHLLLVILSLLTLFTGNLFAIRQQNIKRFLAFSSITQVGFVLVAISSGSSLGTAAVVYFMLVYLFSNLAAFGVVSVIAHVTGKETIDDYRGLYKNNKFLSWVLVIALFSLAGIPPTAGFFGKLFLVLAGATKASVGFIILVVINIVIALYYYLRVVRAVFAENTDNAIGKIRFSMPVKIGMGICLAGILLAGLIGQIYEYILSIS